MNYINNSLINKYGVSRICSYSQQIDNCINYADISSIKPNAAGITTYSEIIFNCSNKGNIVSEKSCAAGIIYTSGDGISTLESISSCSNYGIIQGNSYAGGIACYSWVISNCHNIGNINSIEYAGGISASFSSMDSMKYCYNLGSITGKNNCTGGIVGKTGKYINGETIIFKCINIDSKFAPDEYTSTLCEVSDGTDSQFINLNFDNTIWFFNNDGKPIFLWENK